MSYSTGIELNQKEYTLERALARIYLIKNNGRMSFPKVLQGKRIKIILVEEER